MNTEGSRLFSSCGIAWFIITMTLSPHHEAYAQNAQSSNLTPVGRWAIKTKETDIGATICSNGMMNVSGVYFGVKVNTLGKIFPKNYKDGAIHNGTELNVPNNCVVGVFYYILGKEEYSGYWMMSKDENRLSLTQNPSNYTKKRPLGISVDKVRKFSNTKKEKR